MLIRFCQCEDLDEMIGFSFFDQFLIFEKSLLKSFQQIFLFGFQLPDFLTISSTDAVILIPLVHFEVFKKDNASKGQNYEGK